MGSDLGGIVLDSDPLTDIRATADIDMVMKGGVLYDGETLDEIFGRSPCRLLGKKS